MRESATRGRRADAARNRATLLAAATQAFARAESAPSMRAIAREAGVGMGTLYRHFPTREALVDAVYEDQAKRLTDGATKLLQQFPENEALRRWMDLFGAWLATKRGMLGTLLAGGHPDVKHAASRREMLHAIEALLDAGTATGAIRNDVNAEDVAASLVGIFTVVGGADQRDQAGRLLDLLMDALQAPYTRPATRPDSAHVRPSRSRSATPSGSSRVPRASTERG